MGQKQFRGGGTGNSTAAKASNKRREVIMAMYVRGESCAAIARKLGVSSQRVLQLVRKYKFLPQSRYMLEGALCREWMLRHHPAEYRRIVGEAAEQSGQQQEG